MDDRFEGVDDRSILGTLKFEELPRPRPRPRLIIVDGNRVGGEVVEWLAFRGGDDAA